jgi:hypothetical protein
MNASDICDALGRKAIKEALGVTKASVSHAVREKSFPASWYPVIRDMCEARGIECPVEAFNFKSPAPLDASEGICARPREAAE